MCDTSIICPEMGKKVGTAYSYGCRCSVCKKYRRDYQRQYLAKNPDKKAKLRAYNREYMKNRRDTADEDYKQAERDRLRVKKADRRAQQRATTVSKCRTVKTLYAKAVELGGEVDHVLPLAKGGTHTACNMAVLTPWDNRHKAATHPADLQLNIIPLAGKFKYTKAA